MVFLFLFSLFFLLLGGGKQREGILVDRVRSEPGWIEP